jgi:hypothetical protein
LLVVNNLPAKRYYHQTFPTTSLVVTLFDDADSKGESPKTPKKMQKDSTFNAADSKRGRVRKIPFLPFAVLFLLPSFFAAVSA